MCLFLPFESVPSNNACKTASLLRWSHCLLQPQLSSKNETSLNHSNERINMSVEISTMAHEICCVRPTLAAGVEPNTTVGMCTQW